jgi:hypothetical protein
MKTDVMLKHRNKTWTDCLGEETHETSASTAGSSKIHDNLAGDVREPYWLRSLENYDNLGEETHEMSAWCTQNK